MDIQTKLEALEMLMRIHYDFFMAHPRFWSEVHLRQADSIICKAASDIRAEIFQDSK